MLVRLLRPIKKAPGVPRVYTSAVGGSQYTLSETSCILGEYHVCRAQRHVENEKQLGAFPQETVNIFFLWIESKLQCAL